MKTLRIEQIKKWFDMTLTGVKTEDYRDITLHYLRRFIDTSEYPSEEKGERPFILDSILFDIKNGHNPTETIKRYYSTIKQFDTTKLTNGYSPTDRAFTIECKGVRIGYGNPEWGAPTDREVFIIEHGKVLETFNIDFEAEVKAVYPDAYADVWHTELGDVYYIFYNKQKLLDNVFGDTEREAWQSTYIKLLKQGKI